MEENYLKFWEIEDPVFANSPHEHIYLSQNLTLSLSYLKSFAYSTHLVSLIIGPTGTGKTTLAKWFARSLSYENYETLVCTLMMPTKEPGWLTPKIAQFMGTSVAKNWNEQLEANCKKFDEISAESRKLIIFIDGIELLQSEDAFIEITSILNAQNYCKNTVSFVLVGHHSVEKILSKSQFFSANVGCKISTNLFTREETEEYIAFKTKVLNTQPFSKHAIDAIYGLSKGNLKLVNLLAENCLIECYIKNAKSIGSDIVKTSHKRISISSIVKQDPFQNLTQDNYIHHAMSQSVEIDQITAKLKTPPPPPPKGGIRNKGNLKAHPEEKSAKNMQSTGAKNDKVQDIDLNQLFKLED